MNQRSLPKFNVISLRLTNDELAEIDRLARGRNLTRSAYLRLMATKSSNIPIQIDPLSSDLYKSYLLIYQELRCQGNNLNQIAKGIHRANLEGIAFNGYIKALGKVRAANQDIAAQIGKLGAKL
jgi:Ribbon-helix-helix protein, copG family